MACQPDTPPAVHIFLHSIHILGSSPTSKRPFRVPEPRSPTARPGAGSPAFVAATRRSPRTVTHPPSTLSEHGTRDCIIVEPVRDRNAPPSSGANGPPSLRHRLPGHSGDEFCPSHANTSEGPSMEGVEERRAASQGCLPTRRRPKPVPIDVNVQHLLMCLITACTEPASVAHRHGHYLKLIEALERYRVPRIEFAYDSALAVL